MLRPVLRPCSPACIPAAALAAACGGASRSAEPAEPETQPVVEAGGGEVAPIPDGFERGPVPHLVIAGASEAIEYYGELFDAEELYRAPGPNGIILHAILRIGDSLITLSDEQPDVASFAPGKFGGSPVGLHVYVDDAAEVHARALASGATEDAPVRYQFWGDRHGSFTGPFGHMWSVATRVYDVPEEDRADLAARAMAGEDIAEPEGAEPLAVPEGWSTVTPALIVADVDAAAAFYEEALGATTRTVVPGPGGTSHHAELQFRDQIVMLNRAAPAGEPGDEDDEDGGSPAAGDARDLGGTPVQLTFYVQDAEAVVARVREAGASARLPLQEMFWGDLWGELEDPYGHIWSIATHVQDVTPEEMEARTRELGSS